jgi:hypothetical protein
LVDKKHPTFSFTTSYAQIFSTVTLFAVKTYPETEIKGERKVGKEKVGEKNSKFIKIRGGGV